MPRVIQIMSLRLHALRIAAGADGLIIEVHPDPTHAASDGKQSLKPEKFAEMVKQVKAIAEVMGRRIAPIKKPVTAGW